MEQYEVARELAAKNIKIADHMLTITYPLVKDPKLLLSVMENLLKGYTNAMLTLLYWDRMYKRVPPFHESFPSQLQMFESRCVPRYSIDRSYVALMRDIHDVMQEHRKSSVEFTRKDKFVICTDTYRMRTISIETIKQHIAKAKQFMHEMNAIVSQK